MRSEPAFEAKGGGCVCYNEAIRTDRRGNRMKLFEAMVLGSLVIIACSCSENLGRPFDGSTVDGAGVDQRGVPRDDMGRDVAPGDASPRDGSVPEDDVVLIPATCPYDGEWPATDSFDDFKAKFSASAVGSTSSRSVFRRNAFRRERFGRAIDD